MIGRLAHCSKLCNRISPSFSLNLSMRLPDHCSILQRELTVITKAVEWLFKSMITSQYALVTRSPSDLYNATLLSQKGQTFEEIQHNRNMGTQIWR